MFLFYTESQIYLSTSSLSFVSLCWSRITDKLAINWQNVVRVRLQLKFASIIRTYSLYSMIKTMINKPKTNCFGINQSVSHSYIAGTTAGMNMSIENNMLRLLCQTISVRSVQWFFDFFPPLDKF